ncbi:MAG: ATP-binding protein [Acidobacteriota bacterium]
MIRSLRGKLAISHVVPTLLLLPLLSLYLLYSVESFYTQSLLQQLVYQSQLVRSEIERDPDVPAKLEATKVFLARVADLIGSRVILLNEDATIIASTEKEDASRIGTHYNTPPVEQALKGETAQGLGPGFTTDVAYVVVPLKDHGEVIGALRLSYRVNDVRAQFDQLRLLIIAGIILTVIMAFGLSWVLSLTIARPLSALRASAHGIAAGDYGARVAIRSRDEVGDLAASFNQMAERLEQAEQARERQLAVIAHELARPLTGLRAGLEALQEDPEIEPEMHATLVGGIADELDRLERLIRTLQGLHKRALRPMQLNCAEISPEHLIRACLENFQVAANQLGVNLTAEIPAGLPIIRADEDRIIQVLTNLLDNALKFTPRGGRVVVQAGVVLDSIWIHVADTGVGIAPNELPNVFQQFYRGDESRPPEKRGMGLGLAICREIVVAHGGRIEAESDIGKGARFTFTLPIRN